MKEIYISADVEADGPIPGPYSMLSLGMCVVGNPQLAFYTEICPISNIFNPEALAVSGLDRNRLLKEAPSAEIAMKNAADWVYQQTNPDKWIKEQINERIHPVLVLSPASWDAMFLHWYWINFCGKNPFGLTCSSIDIRSYWMGMHNTTYRGSRTRFIKESVGTLGVINHTHHALDDAKEQAEVFSRILDRNNNRSIIQPVQWLPKGLAESLMNEFHIQAGPQIGKLRSQLTNLCKTGEIEALREISYYVEIVKTHNLVP